MFAMFNPNRHFDASTMRSSPITYTNPFTDSDLSDQLINEWFGRFAAPAGQAPHTRVFNPKFDLRETEEAYELHGELPGLKRENASIEFSDWKTIVVKGRVEREYTAGNSTAPASPAGTSTPAASTAEVAVEDTAAPKKASVSDAEDEDWNEINEKTASPKASKAAVATVDSAQRRSVARPSTQAPANRFVVSERSVGEFSRTFKFPSPIDRDATTATLENGILSVTIPKAAKKEARRIAIN